jgi:hypothetical protein
MDDEPTDMGAIDGDDEGRDREGEEEIHKDDLNVNEKEIHKSDLDVNHNLDNMDALVIDKEKMTSQSREEVTWFGERSAGPMDDEPIDRGAIDGDDGRRDQEDEEEIHKDDLNVNHNLENMDALVIDRETMTSQTREEVTWFWERSGGPVDDSEERNQESEEEIHEDDLYVDYNLGNQDAIVVKEGGEERGEEESWEECDTQTTTVPINDRIHTSRWGGDWREEEEEQLRNLGGYTMHEIRLLTLGNSCTRCGREHNGSCAIGASIPSGCSPGCSQ